jgi:hypothetical protein
MTLFGGSQPIAASADATMATAGGGVSAKEGGAEGGCRMSR